MLEVTCSSIMCIPIVSFEFVERVWYRSLKYTEIAIGKKTAVYKLFIQSGHTQFNSNMTYMFEVNLKLL